MERSDTAYIIAVLHWSMLSHSKMSVQSFTFLVSLGFSTCFISYMCRDKDWWDNDGALNTISMTHPRFPVEHPSRYVVKDSECHPLQPGIWFVYLILAICFRIYWFYFYFWVAWNLIIVWIFSSTLTGRCNQTPSFLRFFSFIYVKSFTLPIPMSSMCSTCICTSSTISLEQSISLCLTCVRKWLVYGVVLAFFEWNVLLFWKFKVDSCSPPWEHRSQCLLAKNDARWMRSWSSKCTQLEEE